jgi:molecular chaperone GrpE (heat shock protein)
MKNASDWNVPKAPFLAAWLVLLAVAGYLALASHHPLGLVEVVAIVLCVVAGSLLGVLPFILEYQATARLLEVNGLTTVADKIQRLDAVASQIAACTNDWTNAQTQADKTAGLAREIATRMGAEVKQFSEFMQRLNDTEKNALRLEVEKLRRAEGDWLQVLVRILDHVFALHAAAEHSGQPRVAAQIKQFQAACHDAARRVGLSLFVAELEEPFNPELHQAVGLKENPPANAVVAETVGAGFKYQGKVVRPVLVRLREPREIPALEPEPQSRPEPEDDSQPQLTLETGE